MPKTSDSIGIKISELGDAGVIKENDVVPVNAKTDAGVAFTKATKINDLRQTLGFENAFLSVDAGLNATVSGDVFFVYETAAKLWVLQYQNNNGVANPILGYDNNQVRLPTSRQIKATSSVVGPAGAKYVPLDNGSVYDAIRYLTPEMFGAVADGVTNNDAVFLKINNFIESHGACILYLSGGSYALTKWDVPENLSVKGTGKKSSKLICTATTAQPWFIRCAAKTSQQWQ